MKKATILKLAKAAKELQPKHKLTVPLLQRRLHLGYGVAQEVMEQLKHDKLK